MRRATRRYRSYRHSSSPVIRHTAQQLGWLWLDPLAGMIGAVVIAAWAYALVRDTGKVVRYVIPDRDIVRQLTETVEREGDQLADFHLQKRTSVA